MNNNQQNVPNRRFKAFETGPNWERRKVTELGKIFIGLVTTMTAHYKDEGVLLIRNSDIKDGRFEFGDNPIYLEETFAQANSSRMHKLGDVITVHTGDVGTSSVIREKQINSLGFATIVTRPNTLLITSDYLCSYLNTPQHKKWAVGVSTGDGRTNYNLGDYYECIVPVPSKEEQHKISEFISCLNKVITLHQHKLDKLKNLKKSYLAELFPAEGERLPKRRFPGFEGEWEEKKLGEVVEFKRGLTYTPSSISKTGIRVLRSSNIDEDQFVLKEDDVFVDESKISIPFVEKGDILITAANGSSRLVGKHAIIDSTEKMVHGGFMLLAKSDQYKFINALLSSNWYTHFIDRSVLGGNGAIGNLSKSDLENEVPLFPSDEEQKQIGEFFQKLDKSISLQQQKLDKLKDMKKAYLNELFV